MTPRDAKPTSSFVRIKESGGVVVATPVGPTIGEREASIINQDVAAALEQTSDRFDSLVLDMREIDFMQSVGVGMCVDLHNRAKALGGKAIILGLKPALAQLFRLMKLDRIFTIVQDEGEIDAMIETSS